KGDAEPGICGPPVVVADEKASDTTEAVSDGQGGSDAIGGGEVVDPLSPQQQRNGQPSAKKSPIPDQAGPVEAQVPIAEENRVVDIGAGVPADARDHQHRRVKLLAQPVAAELPCENPSPSDERQKHHQAEGGD